MQRPLGNGAPGPDSPGPASPQQLEAIRLGCLRKGIDLELILERWRVQRLEDLEEAGAREIQAWLEQQ